MLSQLFAQDTPVGSAVERFDPEAGEHDSQPHMPKLPLLPLSESPTLTEHANAATKPYVRFTAERYIVDDAETGSSEQATSQGAPSSPSLAVFAMPPNLDEPNSPSNYIPPKDLTSNELLLGLSAAEIKNEAKSAQTTEPSQPTTSSTMATTTLATTATTTIETVTEPAIVVPKKHRKPASAEEAAELRGVLAGAQLKRFLPALLAAGHDTCADVSCLSTDSLFALGF